MIESTAWAGEAVGLAGDPFEFRPQGQTLKLAGEAGRVAAEQDGFDPGAQRVVGGNDAFQQPFAEEACGAGNEQACAAQLPPDILGMGENVLQVAGGQDGRLSQSPTPRNSLMRPAA